MKGKILLAAALALVLNGGAWSGELQAAPYKACHHTLVKKRQAKK